MTRIFRVMANPYHCLDHEGRPAAAFPFCPDWRNMQDSHQIVTQRVGATLQAALVRSGSSKTGEADLHDHSWEFSPDAVRVDASDPTAWKYYADAIKSGEILAADLETWCAAGCDRKDFMEPAKALAASKQKAIANWGAHHQNFLGKPELPMATVNHWTAPPQAPAPAPSASPQSPAPSPAKA